MDFLELSEGYMKASVKILYQELIDNIEFPIVVYVYETSRIIAANRYARDIIGADTKLMRSIWLEKHRFIEKEVLDNGSNRYYNKRILVGEEEREIDIEINSIFLDSIHIFICMFDLSYKQCFVQQLNKLVPRCFWKDKNLNYLGINQGFIIDTCQDTKTKEEISDELILKSESYQVVHEYETNVMITRQSQINMLQTIQDENGTSIFTKFNRIPIINKNGTVCGVIGIYTLILNREEYKHLYDKTLRENTLLSEIVSKSKVIGVSWRLEHEWKVDYISPNIIQLGYGPEEFYSGNLKWAQIVCWDDLQKQKWSAIECGNWDGELIEDEFRIATKDGGVRWLYGKFRFVRSNNLICYLEGSVTDITDKKMLEQKLDSSKKAFQVNNETLVNLLENMNSSIYVISKNSYRILYANNRIKINYGTDPTGEVLSDFLREKGIEFSYQRHIEFDQIMDLLQSNQSEYHELYDPKNHRYLSMYCQNIQWQGTEAAMIIHIQDITLAMEHNRLTGGVINKDFLTGIYNHTKLREDFGKELRMVMANQEYGYVVLFDIDHFSTLNQMYGDDACNQLLKCIADKLTKIPGISENCYRIGNDEFAVLIRSEVSKHADNIIEEITAMFQRPFMLFQESCSCTISMGVLKYPENSSDTVRHLQYAQLALKEAKDVGGNKTCYYENEENRQQLRWMKMENYLRNAVLRDCLEFKVQYQPIVNSYDNSITGVEALIRWYNPELGVVNPVDFIPLSEYLGLMDRLGEYVIKEAFYLSNELNLCSEKKQMVSINLSVVQLVKLGFVERVIELTKDMGINPDYIMFEVTESLAVDDLSLLISVLEKLRNHGFHVALDDFGIGCSSLNHIMTLPIDYLKIDKELIQNYGNELFQEKLFLAIVELAQSIGLYLIVEGVETKEQREYLKERSIEYYQGYYFSEPIDREDLMTLLN